MPSSGPAAAELPPRLGRRRDRHLDRAEQGPDRDQGDHQSAKRRRAQGAAFAPALHGLGAPGARDGLRGEGRRPHEEDQPRHGERAGRRPQDAEAQRERRPRDPGELDGRGIDRVGGSHVVGVLEEVREERADARVDGWCRETAEQSKHAQHRERRTCRQQGQRADDEGGSRRAPGEHGRLAPAVDQAAEQRAAHAERNGVGPGNDAGSGE